MDGNEGRGEKTDKTMTKKGQLHLKLGQSSKALLMNRTLFLKVRHFVEIISRYS